MAPNFNPLAISALDGYLIKIRQRLRGGVRGQINNNIRDDVLLDKRLRCGVGGAANTNIYSTWGLQAWTMMMHPSNKPDLDLPKQAGLQWCWSVGLLHSTNAHVR